MKGERLADGRDRVVRHGLVFKLVTAAAKTWRKRNGQNQLPKVIQGIIFRDGVEVIETPALNAA